MLESVESDHVCRSRILLRYFGEKNEHNCSVCDVCIQQRKRNTNKPTKDLKNRIIELLVHQESTPDRLVRQLYVDDACAADALHELIEENKIKILNGKLQLIKN